MSCLQLLKKSALDKALTDATNKYFGDNIPAMPFVKSGGVSTSISVGKIDEFNGPFVP